jgi:protoheme IX farnesyltransferase
LVIVTTVMGFLLSHSSPIEWGVLLAVGFGTAFLGGGANAINQWWEAIPDSKMERTKGRPLPSGRMAPRSGLIFGLAISIVGFASIALFVNALTAILALASWAIYLFAYTPLKRRSTLNTIIGAVSGAIPPVLGWTAATGDFGAGALVLFAILFLWQIPHFLSIAWRHREDYARGGFVMLPVVDPQGRTTFRIALWYTLALIPVTLSAAVVGMAGWLYCLGAMIGGIVLLAGALRLNHERSREAARALFLSTIAYLPALLLLMLLDPTRLPFRLG